MWKFIFFNVILLFFFCVGIVLCKMGFAGTLTPFWAGTGWLIWTVGNGMQIVAEILRLMTVIK